MSQNTSEPLRFPLPEPALKVCCNKSLSDYARVSFITLGNVRRRTSNAESNRSGDCPSFLGHFELELISAAVDSSRNPTPYTTDPQHQGASLRVKRAPVGPCLPKAHLKQRLGSGYLWGSKYASHMGEYVGYLAGPDAYFCDQQYRNGTYMGLLEAPGYQFSPADPIVRTRLPRSNKALTAR